MGFASTQQMTLRKTIRRGFSMVELLIVVAIAMLLIAIAIPMIQPMMTTNRTREAARIVNTYFVGAKARAAETGRPFGVRLIRASIDQTGDPNDCYRMQYVEVPAPYCGDLDNATITVGPRQQMPAVQTYGPLITANPYAGYAAPNISFSAWLDSATQSGTAQLLTNACGQFAVTGGETAQEAWDRAMRNSPISPGDSIKFGTQGMTYVIVDMFLDTATSTPRLTLAPINGTGPGSVGVGYVHWPPNPGVGVYQPYTSPQLKTFQIERKPRVSGSLAEELPRDVSIDLGMSGSSSDGNEFFAAYDPIDIANNSYSNTNYADSKPIDIVFDPSGQLKFVYFGGIAQPANSSIYLLIAQTEKIVPGIGGRGPAGFPNAAARPELALSENLADSEAFWVAIQYPTGTVLTAENLGDNVGNLSLARDIVRSGVAKGSR